MNQRMIEDIRKASRVGYTGARDVVSLLLESAWCEASDLCAVYGAMKTTEELDAVAFFQLPYRITVSAGKRVPLRWEHGDPVLGFSTRVLEHGRSSASDRLSNQLYETGR